MYGINARGNGEWAVSYNSLGEVISAFRTGLKIREHTELGRDIEMGWRNVTLAINELPVCLLKRRLRENVLNCRHLGRFITHCPLHPAAARKPSKMSSVCLGGRDLY